jgi:hypothetical protein
MAQTDHETEVASGDEPSAEMPLPTDPKTIFLGGLFALALLATAYVAGEIVLPMVFAGESNGSRGRTTPSRGSRLG